MKLATIANEFNWLLEKNDIERAILDNTEDRLTSNRDNPIDLDLDLGRYREVNKLFLVVQESLHIITNQQILTYDL